VHFAKNADLNNEEVRDGVHESEIHQKKDAVLQNLEDGVVGVAVDQSQKTDHDQDQNLGMVMDPDRNGDTRPIAMLIPSLGTRPVAVTTEHFGVHYLVLI